MLHIRVHAQIQYCKQLYGQTIRVIYKLKVFVILIINAMLEVIIIGEEIVS